MSKIELDVLFKKMQKDDKKEVLEFHILGDEVPHKTELIEMAGGMANLTIKSDSEPVESLPAEFKSIQRDSKKTVLKFEAKGDSQDKIIKLYPYAGHNITLELEPSQMSIEDFEDGDSRLKYNVNNDGTVDVPENQMTIDEVATAEDEDDLLN